MRIGPAERGLTLVEVLAAVVLLAVLSSVCARLLHVVHRQSAAAKVSETGVDLLELDRFADDVLSDETYVERLKRSGVVDMKLAWESALARPPVRIQLVRADSTGERPPGRWVAFRCAGIAIWRRVESLGEEGER